MYFSVYTADGWCYMYTGAPEGWVNDASEISYTPSITSCNICGYIEEIPGL